MTRIKWQAWNAALKKWIDIDPLDINIEEELSLIYAGYTLRRVYFSKDDADITINCEGSCS